MKKVFVKTAPITTCLLKSLKLTKQKKFVKHGDRIKVEAEHARKVKQLLIKTMSNCVQDIISSHVRFYMYLPTFPVGKSLFTLRAGIGLFSCVNSTVRVEGTGQRERLGTGGAGKGPISCVCPLVSLQNTRLRESLVSLRAWIRFLPV